MHTAGVECAAVEGDESNSKAVLNGGGTDVWEVRKS